MEAALVVWLISLLDPLSLFLQVTTHIVGFLIILSVMSDKSTAPLKSLSKRWVATLLLSALGWLLIPNTQTGYIMAGAYFGQSLIQSEESQKVYDLIIKKVEKDLGEAQ